MTKLPPITLKTTPFDHQREVTDLSWDMEYYGLLMEMGTGKTKVVIDSFAALAYEGKIDGVLILAPKGVYLNWVKNEIPAHIPDQIDYGMTAWSSSANTEQLKEIQIVIQPPQTGVLDIFVMNIEALVSDRAYGFAIAFLENHRAMTIIDESTCIKNMAAARTKKSFLLGKYSHYRRIMTGTPITQSPLDLYSQFHFLKPGCLGFNSFTAFRSYYAVMTLMRLGNRAFQKVDGYRNLERLQRDIERFSYRKLKSECLDLPDKLYETRLIEMTPEQRKIYEQFRDEALLQLESEQVTSTSALTTIMRLQQIACGHVTTDEHNVVSIPHNRLTALDELIEECTGKIIIWANFKHDVREIVDHLNEVGIKTFEYAVHYYGDTPDKLRAENLEAFHNDPNCRFFVGTPGTGGRGLTLVESHTTIYYSNGYNLEHRLQSEDRNHRIGQRENVTIIDIVCEKTVDERIVKLLKAKQDLATMVLDTFREMLI